MTRINTFLLGVIFIPLFIQSVAGVSNPRVGINYQTKGHELRTPDGILERDFKLFSEAGVSDISISLYWYRLEGDARGDYDGSEIGRGPWGDRVLENAKRIIRKAYDHGLRTMVTIHTLWGSDSEWCTPGYAVDPVSGKARGIAVVRDPVARDGFIETFTRTVEALKSEPGIWAWAILNEPWYWPHELPEPYEEIDQFENFVELIQSLSSITRERDERPVVIRFNNVKIHSNDQASYEVKDIFVEDFRYDPRILDAIDIVGFNVYRPAEGTAAAEQVLERWSLLTADHFSKLEAAGKRYMITEMGYGMDNDALQERCYLDFWTDVSPSKPEAVYSWQWSPYGTTETCNLPGTGHNLCADIDGNPRPALHVLTSWNTDSMEIKMDLKPGLNLIGWLGPDCGFGEILGKGSGPARVWKRDCNGSYSFAKYCGEDGSWWSPDEAFTGLNYGEAYFLECDSHFLLETTRGVEAGIPSIREGTNLIVWRSRDKSFALAFPQNPDNWTVKKIWHRTDSGEYDFAEYYPSIDCWWSPQPIFTELIRGKAYFVESVGPALKCGQSLQALALSLEERQKDAADESSIGSENQTSENGHNCTEQISDVINRIPARDEKSYPVEQGLQVKAGALTSIYSNESNWQTSLSQLGPRRQLDQKGCLLNNSSRNRNRPSSTGIL